MKKLNKKYKIALLSVLLSCAACTDLDETIYSDISAEKTQLTAEDLTNIIAPAFSKFRDVYWGWNGLFDLYEESSDLIVTPFRNGIGWGDLYITMHLHALGTNFRTY